jgi:hypothetical protein
MWAFPFVFAVLVGVQAGIYVGSPGTITLAGLVFLGCAFVWSLVFAAVTTVELGRDRRGQMIERRRAATSAALQRAHDALDREHAHSAETWEDRQREQ